MFVIEGPDGAGKTTVARDVSNRLGLLVQHAGGPPTTGEELSERHRRQIYTLENGTHILDRCALVSELVYGPVLRGGLFVPDEVIHSWIEQYRRRDFVFLFCKHSSRSFNEHLKRMVKMDEGKEYKPEAHNKEVKQRLNDIVERYDVVADILRRNNLEVWNRVRS